MVRETDNIVSIGLTLLARSICRRDKAAEAKRRGARMD